MAMKPYTGEILPIDSAAHANSKIAEPAPSGAMKPYTGEILPLDGGTVSQIPVIGKMIGMSRAVADFATDTLPAGLSGAARATAPAASKVATDVAYTAADLKVAAADVVGQLPGLSPLASSYGRFQRGVANAAASQSQEFAREGEAIRGEFDDGSFGYHAVGIGQSLPAMAGAAVVSAFGSPLAGAAFMGATTGVGQYSDARAEGADRLTAGASGLAHGVLEGGTEYLTLGIAKYGAKPVFDRLAQVIGPEQAKVIVSSLANSRIARGSLAASTEAVGEVLTTTGQMGSDEFILGKDYALDDYIKGWRDSAIQGGVMGAGAYGVTAGLESRAQSRATEGRSRLSAVAPAINELAGREATKEIIQSQNDEVRTFGDEVANAPGMSELLTADEALDDIAQHSSVNAQQLDLQQQELADNTPYMASAEPRAEGESDKAYAKRVVDQMGAPRPAHLPDNPSDYFDIQDGDQIVEIGQLRSTKTEAENVEGGTNGAKRMAAAREGKLGKRVALSGRLNEDGTISILDGNGTLTASKAAGITKLPVKLKESVQFGGWKHISSKVWGRVVEIMPNFVMHENGRFNKPKFEYKNDPHKPLGVLKDEHQIARLGAAMKLAEKALPKFNKTVSDFGASIGAKVKLADLKGRFRAEEKMQSKVGEKPGYMLKDLVRATLVVNSPAEANALYERLVSSGELGEIVYEENGEIDGRNLFAEGVGSHEGTGYRDAQLIVRLKNGTLAEIQISTPAMSKAKMEAGHKYYEIRRSLEALSAERALSAGHKTDSRTSHLKTEELALHGEVVAAGLGLYESAFADDLKANRLQNESSEIGDGMSPPASGGTASMPSGSTANSVDSSSRTSSVPSSTMNLVPGGKSPGLTGLSNESAIENSSTGGTDSVGESEGTVNHRLTNKENEDGSAEQSAEEAEEGRRAGPDGQEDDGRAEEAAHGEAGSTGRAQGADGAQPGHGSSPAPVTRAAVDKAVAAFKAATELDAVVVDDYSQIPGAPSDDGVTTALFHGGKIYIVASRQVSADQTALDLVHEATHLGLRALLGKQYDAIMRAVYDHARANPNSAAGIQLRALEPNYPGADPIELADEVVAHLSENYKRISAADRSILNRVTAAIRSLLRKLGRTRTVNDDTVFNLIRDAHTKVTSGGKAASAARAKKRVAGDRRVSQRLPTAVKSKENPLTDNLDISIDAMLRDQKIAEKAAQLLREYPGIRVAADATNEQVIRAAVKHIEANLLWLHDQMPADIRERAKLWYDGANAIAKRFADIYGINETGVAGALAALSPQMDWYKNVSLAERVLDIYTSKQGHMLDDEMLGKFDKVLPLTNIKGGPIKENPHLRRAVSGKRLSDLEDKTHKAVWIRLYDEAHNPRGYHVVSPEGDFIGAAKKLDGEQRSIGWGSFREIAKAVSAIEDPRFENVNRALGEQHKVRNFFNNIIAPNAGSDVTIDTHAVAAGLLRPLSGTSLEVSHNFGSSVVGKPGTANSSVLGVQGLYGIYADAYRGAAKKRGILPREMQSITWEAVRGLFPDASKAGMIKGGKFEAIWADYGNRTITAAAAQRRTLEAANGVRNPTWYGTRGPDGLQNVGGRGASYAPELHRGELESGAGSVDVRARGGDADGAAGLLEGGDGGARVRARRRPGGSEGRADSPLAGYPNGGAGPDPALVEVAEGYAKSRGIDLRRQPEYAKVDPERARRIAQAYEDMAHAPQDPAVRAAYESLIEQTTAQYKALTEAGYTFWLMDPAADPYAANPAAAMRDLRSTKSMAVFPTDAGFGSSEFDVAGNPLMADTGIRWPYGSPTGELRPVLANDLFRAVHDAFGHGLEGAGFRARGEENAWQAHVRLFTGPAIGAITSETRGQNSWLNYGPHGETNRTAAVEDTVFADQKTGLMPEWTWTEGRLGTRARRRPDTKAVYEARVDALLAGATPAQRGVRMLDSSDVMALLGYPEVPMELAEEHIRDNHRKGRHPEITAEVLKQLPAWIENPAAVFKSQQGDGRLTMVGPELVDGREVIIAIEPNPGRPGEGGRTLMVTAYAKNGPVPYGRWVREDLLLYVNMKNAPKFWQRGGFSFPSQAALSPGRRRIVTERQLGGYRRGNGLEQDGADLRGQGADSRRRTRAQTSSGFSGYTIPTESFEAAYARATGGLLRRYLEGVKAAGRRGRRLLQDDLLAVKQAQELVEAHGQYDGQTMDVYRLTELFHGRTGYHLEGFRRDHVLPLLDAINADADLDIADLENFLYATYAPHRNRKIYELHRDRADAADWVDGGSGMTNRDATDILLGYQQRGLTARLTQLANRIYAMNEARISLLEASGLISPEMATEWRSEPYYVPLKGLGANAEPAFDFGPRAGKGYSVSGKESKMAKGRKSRAENLIENVVAQGELAIVRAEKNRVAQSLAAMVVANPNPDLWTIERVKVRVLRDKATGEVIEDSEGDALLHRHYPNDRDPPVFSAKVQGKEVMIRFHGEGGRRMVEGMKNLGAANLGAFLQHLRGVNRWLSMSRTMLNPEFVISNFARDIQTAMTNISAEDGEKLARNTLKGIKPALAAVFRHERSKSGSGGAAEWDQWYREFAAAGGRTYFANARDIDEIVADVKGEIARSGHGATKRGVRRAWDAFVAANTAVENASRLSAYVAARKAGKSKAEAASLAKNLTVNFNRRGQAGPTINALYMFANASIQGTARYAQFIAKHPAKAMKYNIAPMFALGVAISFLNAIAGGDDDDGEERWAKVADFEKDRNLVVMWGENKFKIPLPYVYNLPYVAGMRLADAAQGLTSVGTALSSIAGAVLDGINPIAGGAPTWMHAVSPTLVDPVADIWTNTNYFGAPVRPEATFEKYEVPDSEKYWEGRTPEWQVWMSQSLNTLTGGNRARPGAIDVSPTSVGTWLDFAGGGLYGFLEKSAQSLTEAPSGGNLPPFLRKVYGRVDERQNQTDYYAFRSEAHARIEEAEIAREMGLPLTREEKREHGITYSLAATSKSTEKRLKSLRKARKLALARDDDDAADRLTEKMYEEQGRFNRIYVEKMRSIDEPLR